jgi:hypothetical protein
MTPPIFSQFSSGGGGRAKGFGMGPMKGGGLYDFSYASFGGTGGNPNGPGLSEMRSGLSGGETSQWKNDTQFFGQYSGGIQYWTVPTTGTYRIQAEGARGAYPRGGGYAARMRGDFNLEEAETVRIVIGQTGNQNGHPWGGTQGAGGGGTYVTRTPHNSNGSILVVAGGGGAGCGTPWSNQGGDNANTGQSGNGPAGGGSSGNGGGSSNGGGGAGFFGDGSTPSGTPSGQRARSYTSGSRGGYGPNSWGGQNWGGFGGGGGCGLAGGGGGGYSGGGSGDWSSNLRGGGGGSRNNGSNQSNSRSNRGGNGVVTVEFLG